MHSADRNSQAERRLSKRRSRRVSVDNDAFSDDEYDLAANTVSDGFRPTADYRQNVPNPDSAPSIVQTQHQVPNLPQSPPPVASSSMKGGVDFNRPPSTSKPPRFHDSLTLRNDGLEAARGGQSSSSNSFAQGDVLYRGSTQPSHPYEMYHQRTYSNATSTTNPSSGTALDAVRGPTHPYALYTQSTITSEDSSHQPIPLGFNGMENGYRRQIGPDGEDAGDLIGPLGHMEELPPYSRYPEETFQTKLATDGENNAAPGSAVDGIGTRTSGSTTAPPIQPIPGAGGIGLATRNPEFSTEDLAGIPQRPGSSIRSSSTSLESDHDINGAARDFTEKPSPGKWQRTARKKFWGVVPYWTICLLLLGIVIMGVVMGTVIGTIVTRHNGPKRKGDGKFRNGQQSMRNVEPLSRLPPGLPPLATGSFALPPMDKSQVPKACIKDLEQSLAWSCDIPFRWYSMNVTERNGDPENNNYAMNLSPFDPNASKFIYGSQPPYIPDFMPMQLVKDMVEVNRGPAWFLQVEYNKTVMLREDMLAYPGKANSKRRSDTPESPFPGFDSSRFLKKGLSATAGDQPWICTWPSITLQIFIYPNQTFLPTSPTSIPSPTIPMTGAFSSSPPTPTPDILPSNFKKPYPRLVKFVERHFHEAANSAPATCTQYKILNNGQDKEPVLQDGKPVTFIVEEVGHSAEGSSTESLHNPKNPRHVSSLEGRDVDLTPCGCVSFLWGV
ncbi:hypothetical protein NOR_00228 [Metarhizium rileyi]|uniref:DUF7820 domain-containing protein n=1 Tax=Metarhizium rileyi (strain RCEF 4871) TaxID=1649241 RepID=A0A162I2W7_METRR|nr:hypothetical protein NOR_00228 [Metarhizium rileyi RCEF 4871]